MASFSVNYSFLFLNSSSPSGKNSVHKPPRALAWESETGNRWYNFDPMTNLECGARCILDSEDNDG